MELGERLLAVGAGDRAASFELFGWSPKSVQCSGLRGRIRNQRGTVRA